MISQLLSVHMRIVNSWNLQFYMYVKYIILFIIII